MPASRKNWDAAAVIDGRKLYLQNPALWGIPTEWKAGACHHKISKENLELLARALERCQNQGTLPKRDRDEDRAAAAKKFWGTVQKAFDPKLFQRQLTSATYAKVLWNMPVNLEVGPENVAENPGQNFDPNTEAIPDGSGERQLTAESVSLQALEAVCVPKLRRDRDYLPSADEWETMDKALAKAIAHHSAYYQESGSQQALARPRTEQWVAAEDGFQRKRLRRFLDPAVGRATFAGNRVAGEISQTTKADVTALGVAWPQTGASPYTVHDSDHVQHIIRLSLAQDQMEHMCLRHTYPYFERVNGAVKLVNNFWPTSRVSAAAQCHQLVTQAFPIIAQAMLDCMEAAEVLEEYEGLITAVNVPNGQDTIFFMARFITQDPVSCDWQVKLITFAPDGATAETYPSAVLKQIM